MDLAPQTQRIIAVVADFFVLLGLAAPVFTAVPAICRTNTVGRRSPLPNIAALLSCCMGMLYGCACDDCLAVAVSSSGATLQAIYLTFFVWYTAARRQVLFQCLVPALAYLVLLTLYLVGAADDDTLAFMSGTCGCFIPATIAYNLYKVRQDATMECMPHLVVPLLALVSAPLLLVYAYAGKELKLYVAIPNGVGLASALLQLGLHFLFFSLKRLQSDVEAGLRECLLK